MRDKYSRDSEWAVLKEREAELLDGDPLNYRDILYIALENDPDIRASWRKALAAHAEIMQSAGDLLPEVTGNFEMGKQKNLSNHLSDRKNIRYYGPELTFSWLVFDFGGRGADIRSAKEAAFSSNFQFNQEVQDLALEAFKAYLDVYTYKALVEASKASVRDAERSYEAAQQKLKAGLGVKLDVLQARSDYVNELYDLEDAGSSLKTARGVLASTIGLPPDTAFEIAPPPQDLPFEDILEEDVVSVIDYALAHRPDIASARAGLRSSRAAAEASYSDLLPKLVAGGDIGRKWYESFGPDKYNTWNDSYSGYLSVQWEIFNGFENFGKAKAARQQAESYRQQLMRKELDASSDVWGKYYSLGSALKKLEYSKDLFVSSEEAYRLAYEGYRAGLKDILDLLNAQSDLSDARYRVVKAESDLLSAMAGLVHATGMLGTPDDKFVTDAGVD